MFSALALALGVVAIVQAAMLHTKGWRTPLGTLPDWLAALGASPRRCVRRRLNSVAPGDMVRVCRCITSIRTRNAAPCIGPPSASGAPVSGWLTDSALPLASTHGYTVQPAGAIPQSWARSRRPRSLTTGAKSGQPRETQLTYFHDGPDPILIASYGGGPKNPQWYYNLKAHPECQFGDEKFVATEVTDPDEYARLYGLAERVYAGYGD